MIIFSDSDAQVPPDFLRETVACTESPKIGLGFGAPAYQGAKNWAAALMAVTANAFVLRLASMCLFGAFDGAVGTTMVARKEVIEQAGGLEQFGRQIADDLPLARAIRDKGYQAPARATGPDHPPDLQLRELVVTPAAVVGNHSPLLAEEFSGHDPRGSCALVGLSIPGRVLTRRRRRLPRCLPLGCGSRRVPDLDRHSEREVRSGPGTLAVPMGCLRAGVREAAAGGLQWLDERDLLAR